MKFSCKMCGGDRLQKSTLGEQYEEILGIDSRGELVYDRPYYKSDFVYFSCLMCGEKIRHENGIPLLDEEIIKDMVSGTKD